MAFAHRAKERLSDRNSCRIDFKVPPAGHQGIAHTQIEELWDDNRLLTEVPVIWKKKIPRFAPL